jgi:ubiquinol-cytochrome c reductase cytochrome b subunit
VSQQNFDAQWISTQAKDAMNSAGVGAFFNLMNFGQMYSYHVLLLPLAVVALVVAHVLLVRRHGVVPPFQLAEQRVGATGSALTRGADGAPPVDGARGAPQTTATPEAAEPNVVSPNSDTTTAPEDPR